MTLEKFFEKLSFGVFSNLDIGIQGGGTIAEEDRPKVISHINDGLVRLYTRFILKEKQVIIGQVDHITNYWLLERFSESRNTPDPLPGVPYAYIKDLNREQFVDDVIKIMSAYHNGHVVPINDSELPASIFTPQAKLVQIPFAKTGEYTGIGYQAKHPIILPNNLQQEIEVPDVLEGALIFYVAGKIFSAIGTQDAKLTSQEHMGAYDNVCNEVQNSDTVNSSISTTPVTKFRKGGWV